MRPGYPENLPFPLHPNNRCLGSQCALTSKLAKKRCFQETRNILRNILSINIPTKSLQWGVAMRVRSYECHIWSIKTRARYSTSCLISFSETVMLGAVTDHTNDDLLQVVFQDKVSRLVSESEMLCLQASDVIHPELSRGEDSACK